jgi:hypothetical protein
VYTSNTRVWCITIHIEGLLDIRVSQDWCGGKKLLHSEKNHFTLLTPNELVIFSRSLVIGEITNKSVIISRLSEKTTDLRCWSWRLPFKYLFNLAGSTAISHVPTM